MLNATNDWVYFDLVNAVQVTSTGNWQIAFNRYDLKLNGGKSGSGTVGGFVGETPAGFYDSNDKPVAAKFQSTTPADTLADLTAANMAKPATASAWIKDSVTSSLDPASQGTYPSALNYGWYTYYPTAATAGAAGLPAVAHLIQANPGNASLLRTGEGTGYARFHLTKSPTRIRAMHRASRPGPSNSTSSRRTEP